MQNEKGSKQRNNEANDRDALALVDAQRAESDATVERREHARPAGEQPLVERRQIAAQRLESLCAVGAKGSSIRTQLKRHDAATTTHRCP